MLSSNAGNYVYGLSGGDIYDWSTLKGSLQSAQNLAAQYYTYRVLFGGITSAGNALGSNYPGATIAAGQTNAGGVGTITAGSNAASGTYWTITQAGAGGGAAGAATVTGTFFNTTTANAANNTQYLATASTAKATEANNVMSAIYSNISSLADYAGLEAQYGSGGNAGVLNGQGATGGQLPTYANALNNALANGSTIQSVGSQLVNALANTSTGLGEDINNMNGVLFGTNVDASTAGKAIFTRAAQNTNGTQYTTTAGTLGALQAINTLNNLVVNGIAGTTPGSAANTNWTTAIAAIGAPRGVAGAVSATAIDAITNNILNVNNPNNPSGESNEVAAINALATLNSGAADWTGANSDEKAAISKALKGLVNPNGYSVVYNTYQAIKSDLGTSASGKTPATGLQLVFGASSAGQAFADAVKFSDALAQLKSAVTAMSDVGGKGANAANVNTAVLSGDLFGGTTSLAGDPLKNALKALFDVFGAGGGSTVTTPTDYQSFSSVISKLEGLAQANVNAGGTSTTLTNTTTTTTSGTDNKSTQYPVQTASTAGAGNPYITSYSTQQATNSATYQQALNQALGTLLGQAASYAGNVATLKSLLKAGSASAALMDKMLTQAINNAAGNAIYNSGSTEAASAADAINNQAKVYNTIKAAIASHDLLDSYVDAITATTYNTTTNQQTQASALNDLYKALNASTSGAAATQGMLGVTQNDITQGQLDINNVKESIYSVTQLENAFGLVASGQVGGLNTTNTALAWNQTWNATNIASAVGTLFTDMGTFTGYYAAAPNTGAKVATAAGAVDAIVSSYTALTDNLKDLAITLPTGAPGNATGSPLVIAAGSVTLTNLQDALAYLASNNSTAVNTVFTAVGSGDVATAVDKALTALVGGDTSGNSDTAKGLAAFNGTLKTGIGVASATNIGDLIKQATTMEGTIQSINGMLNSSSALSDWSNANVSTLATALLNSANNATWSGYVTSATDTSILSGTAKTAFDKNVNSMGVSGAVNTLETQVQNALNAINAGEAIGFGGVAGNGQMTLSVAQMNSLLGTSGVTTANEPLAAAAVNSLQIALNALATGGANNASLVNVGLSGLSLSSTNAKGATTSGTLNTLLNDASNLNSAVQTLYGDAAGFFSTTANNLSSTSNIYVNGTNQLGLGSTSVGGQFASNATAAAAYLSGIDQLGTIYENIGSVFQNTAKAGGPASYAASQNYTTVFGTDGNNGVANTIVSNSSALTSPASGFSGSNNINSLVSKLETLSPSTTDTQAVSAIGSLFTTPGTDSSGDALNAWNAWKAIAYGDSGKSDTGGALSQLNGALLTGGSSDAVKNLDLSGSDATSVDQVVALINMASTLNTAIGNLATGAPMPYLAPMPLLAD